MEDRRFQQIALAMVLLTAAGLLAIRLAAPPNLTDNDQERPASYVLDTALNGHWIVQRDWMGGIASKPPLYTWLAALATLAAGRANLFSLYLPAALSVTGMALVVLLAGRRLFSQPAGLLGAMMFLLSPMMSRQIALARTDALFGFMVSLAALAAFGRRWTLFWFLAALATLAKGPLGVLLAAGGLVVWRRDGTEAVPPDETRRDRLRPVRSNLWGVVLYLLITLGWFFLAWHVGGQPFVDRELKRELLGHILASDSGTPPFVNFYKPFPYFLHRFAPWSLLACVGFWRVIVGRARRGETPRPTCPSAGESETLFERFLFGWFWVGMIIFSVSPHQRADLMAPIIPPAALLAGRELARWLKSVRPARLILGTAAVAVALLGYTASRYYGMASWPEVQRTLGMKALAGQLREKTGGAPIIHVDTPFTLQFYLNTMQIITPPDDAGRMLAGANPVIVAACDWNKVAARLPTGLTFVEVARWPKKGEAFVRVMGNQ